MDRYLNLLARDLGYRTRVYAALSIPNAAIGEVDLRGTGGNCQWIQCNNWEISDDMQSKDGTAVFDHYSKALDDTIPLEDATHFVPARMQNYDFWDWDDAYEAEQADDAVSSATQSTGNS